MTSDTDILQKEISKRTAQGWELESRTETEARMRKPKWFSFLWAFFWFLFLGVGVMVYVFYYMLKNDQLVYIRVVDGQLDVTSSHVRPRGDRDPLIW